MCVTPRLDPCLEWRLWLVGPGGLSHRGADVQHSSGTQKRGRWRTSGRCGGRRHRAQERADTPGDVGAGWHRAWWSAHHRDCLEEVGCARPTRQGSMLDYCLDGQLSEVRGVVDCCGPYSVTGSRSGVGGR
ncbi:hypothetical protein NDU88_004829 [Pleurodeles waltl]|uniref:Uncharacterized protein n=1 Tax=Pleurodeles waltl TaxID=8319 RepID=A0AAV7M8K5_PLEWA|nr:hypothetical protein NDU88_004829 [Pleurodeles waltl]